MEERVPDEQVVFCRAAFRRFGRVDLRYSSDDFPEPARTGSTGPEAGPVALPAGASNAAPGADARRATKASAIMLMRYVELKSGSAPLSDASQRTPVQIPGWSRHPVAHFDARPL